MANPQVPICVIPTGLPPITTPTSIPSPTSYVYTISTSPRPFNHVVVFLIPGIELPPNTACAVYIALPTTSSVSNPVFKFLGGIGPGKESAVFKISGLGNSSGKDPNNRIEQEGREVDMDAPEGVDPPTTSSNNTAGQQGGDITLGISMESAESVSQQMAALSAASAQNRTTSASNSQVMVKAGGVGGSGGDNRADATVLAQRIIKNAFNFLAGFSGNVNGGVEVVPLKAFEEWWRKFEGRVRSDPGFLERDGD
jgi:hypothetical protein